MHPALSVMAFTVTSGLGLGLLILSILFSLPGLGGLAQSTSLSCAIVGLILTALGLISSTFHLANPKNAWRAFSRFKSSWLSREGIFAVLLFPAALLYLFGIWSEANALIFLFGLLTVLLALATLFATGMIYAVLRTIPQWNNALVPANYILLGLASGALALHLMVLFQSQTNVILLVLAIVLLIVAVLGKLLYFVWIGTPHGPTINTATGFTRANVKLLDIGHSSGTFNTKEFGYQAPIRIVSYLRWGVFLMLLIVPFGFILISWQTGSALAAALALLAALVGLFMERWLFFAEARHSVNLFHGQQRC